MPSITIDCSYTTDNNDCNPNTQYGTQDGTIAAKLDACEYQAFLRFGEGLWGNIPSGSDITDATLHVRSRGTITGNDNTIWCVRNSGDWSGFTTWNNSPNYWTPREGNMSLQSGSGQWSTCDVTYWAQRSRSDTHQAYLGLRLMVPDGKSVDWGGNMYDASTAYNPYVVVTYTDPDPSPVANFTFSGTTLNKTFTDTSTDPGGGIVSRVWNFGDGSPTATTTPITHRYNAPGTYNVTLTVTDTAGQTNTTTKSVTVTNAPPVANFTISGTGSSRTFVDTSTDVDGSISSRIWSFGDGSPNGAGTPVTHEYSPGSYTVTLTVTDDIDTSSSRSQIVTIVGTSGNQIGVVGGPGTPPVPEEPTQSLPSLRIFNIGASVDDQQVTGQGSSSVTPYASQAYSSRNTTSGNIIIERSYASGFTTRQALLKWDTSVLPDDTEITNAYLRVCPDLTPTNADARNLIADYYAWNGGVTSDWTLTAPASPILSESLSSFINETDHDVPITDLSGISKTGYTSMRLYISGGQPTGVNDLWIHSSESTTKPGPRLIVEYTSVTEEAANGGKSIAVIPITGPLDDVYTNPNENATYANQTYLSHDYDQDYIKVQKNKQTLYEVHTGLLAFDTSLLPTNILLDSAALRWWSYGSTNNANLRNFLGEYYDWSGTASDWTLTGGNNAWDIPIPVVVGGASHTIPLSNIGNISLVTKTKLRMSISGTAPVGELNSINVASYEHDTIPASELVVYYTAAPPPTFPQVVAANSGNQGTDTTSHIINLPPSIIAGDLLMIFLDLDGSTSISAAPIGWTYLNGNATGSPGIHVLYKIATGSEGSTVSISSTASEQSAHITYRINNWHGTTPPEISTVFTGAVNSPNPMPLDPTGWGVEDTLWIAVGGWDDGTTALIGYPTGVPDNRVSALAATSTGVGIAVATVDSAVSSYDPQGFQISATEAVKAYTVAVRPAPYSGILTRNFLIPSSANDYFDKTAGSTYMTGGFIGVDTSKNAITLVVQNSNVGAIDPAPWYQSNAFLRWDTSIIPTNAIINSASLTIYVISVGNANDKSLVADWFNWQGTSADHNFDSPLNPILNKALSGITPGIVNIPITDLSGIAKGGITSMRLEMYRGAPTGTNQVSFSSVDDTDPSHIDPQLTVIYTVP